ncbi:MAG: response regulator [Actinobacteria bacterium]|nr:response regulator [Actinomycetota bacterium]MBV8395632.1 response regulator [Actinomycetota bacterium]
MPLVLCADDDEDILALVALRLERVGYRVARATNGDDALALARELKPDVAVVDVMMPRRSGLDVLRELRAGADTRELPVVLLSARAQDADVERGLAAGANAYLAKPFTARELIATVEGLLPAQSLR